MAYLGQSLNSISGYSGLSGASGFSGYSGGVGSQGVSGFSGFSGATGAGTQGVSGFSGYSGLSGASGFSGGTGSNGVSGFSGFSGASGFSGYSGGVGTQGVSGFSGFSGGTGSNGISGTSGFSGYSGTAYLLRVTSLGFGTTITPNADTTDILNIAALSANTTFANPTGSPVDGQRLTLRLREDSSGGWLISWGANYAFGTDITAVAVPTSPSAKWEMLFEYNATDIKWRAMAIVRGF